MRTDFIGLLIRWSTVRFRHAPIKTLTYQRITRYLSPLLERFFTHRLMQERRVSPHTIGSYRDTFRLFLKFVQERLRKAPCRRHFEAPLVTAFLDHLEKQRGVSIRSRNLRLTAVHSFFRYMAYELPTHSAQIQRVLAIPSKRLTRNSGPLPDAPGVQVGLLAAAIRVCTR